MSSSQQGRGRGRGGVMPSGPLAQRGRGRGWGNDNPPQGQGSGNDSQDWGQSSQSSTGPPPDVYGNGTFARPSEEVQNIEEQYLQDYGGKREELENELENEHGNLMMPYRPNYGSQGEEVTLWANYFHLQFPGLKLHKYNISIQDQKKVNKDKKDDGKVTGRKAMDIFQVILQQVRRDNGKVVFATDFKQKIVATTPFNLLPATVVYPVAQGARSRKYDLTISHQPIDVEDLLRFLNNQAQTPRLLLNPNPNSNASGFPFHQDIIDAIGTITSHTSRESGDIVTVGRSRFFSKTNQSLRKMIGVSNVLQILKGFSQSVRPATGRLLLNVNVTHGVFRCPGSISHLLETLGGYKRESLQKLDRIISKARVRYRVPVKGPQQPWKVVTIAGLARNTDKCGDQSKDPKFKVGKVAGFWTASEVEFCVKKPPNKVVPARPAQGLEWDKYYTVSDYYSKKHGYQTQRDLPVVNVGRPTDPVYVPAECCELLGFDPIRYELESEESSQMIRFAVKRPLQNAESIVDKGVSQVLKLNSSNTLLAGLGITIEPQLISVKGRQLKSPDLLYGAKLGVDDKTLRCVEEAAWNLKPDTPGSLSFFETCRPINRWTWFVFSPDLEHRGRLTTLMERFQSYLRELGVRFLNQATPSDGLHIPYKLGDSVETLKHNIETTIGKRDLDFALVILPSTQADIYTAVKLVGDIWLGFHTVCVTAQNFLVFDRGQYANLATKINLKFGGTNHGIFQTCEPFHSQRTMLVGYDVVHPTGQAGNMEELKSQVGLVASIGKKFGQWRSCYWTQPANQEVLDDAMLTKKFGSLLELFRASGKGLPTNILIYRDGVSEGQYLQVLKKELPRIRTACDDAYGADSKPDVTLIVSVKRHATRFFPTSDKHTDKSKNIKNGTVVDRGVTQARCWDFYLKSHVALKGTARPAHYVVLHDEIFGPRHSRKLAKPVSASDALAAGKKSVEDLEAFTHQLCYIFGRATKAISICTPARYADIVCTRARLHVSGLARLASRPGLSDDEKEKILAKTVHPNLGNTMYWI